MSAQRRAPATPRRRAATQVAPAPSARAQNGKGAAFSTASSWFDGAEDILGLPPASLPRSGGRDPG